MSKKLIVCIVEGDTEKYFYDLLFKNFSSKKNEITFKVINAKGITKISDKVVRKYDNFRRKLNLNVPTVIFICYDNDVFKYQQKPRIDIEKLIKDLKRKDTTIFKLIAYDSIEDCFLKDKNSIINYLGISLGKNNTIKGKTGEEKLNNLFEKANKVYIKGSNQDSGRFIESLNLDIIVDKNKKMFAEFIDEINKIS